MNQTADALDNLLPADRAAVEDVDQEEDEIILHQRERSEDLEHPEFGRISKSYNRWENTFDIKRSNQTLTVSFSSELQVHRYRTKNSILIL